MFMTFKIWEECLLSPIWSVLWLYFDLDIRLNEAVLFHDKEKE